MAVDTPLVDHSRQIRGLVDLCLIPEPVSPTGRRVGDYELLEKIGGGGMGSVWRARQIRLQREVAVKILHEDLAAEQAFTEAFRQEAEITATLKHAGIVPVHEAGEVDGKWFYAMDWVDADNLEEVLREHGTLPPREAVRIVRDAAAAVGYAHGKGVLHRDLKPSNLLIDGAKQVRVLDFGLARWIGPVASGRTAPLLGTPHYVAPEQAVGGASGPPADVYSLGAVLYRILSGTVPFAGENPMEVLDRARKDPPERLRRLNAAVHKDIEGIVAKCLEKSPGLRYPEASALAADLDRWLEGKPVRARPVGALGRLRRWVKREPFQAALAAVLALGVAGTLTQYFAASRLRASARRDGELVAMKLAATTLREGHRGEAMRLFSQSFDDSSINKWGFPARWLRQEFAGQADVKSLTPHRDKVWGMVLADGDRALVTSSEDGTVAVHDVTSGGLRFSLRFPAGAPYGLCPTPGGGRVLVTGMSGESRFLDLASESWLPGPTGLDATWTTRTAAGSWWAALIGNPHFWEKEGKIRISRAAPGGGEWSLNGKRAAFSPDGKRVAIGRAPKELRRTKEAHSGQVVEIYQLETGFKEAELTCDGTPASVRYLAWSADGLAVAAAAGNRIHLWHLDTSHPAWTCQLGAGVWQVGFSGKSLWAACSDQVVRVLDAASGAESHVLRGHRNEVWCAQPLPDGRLAGGAKDGAILIWPGLDSGKSEVVNDRATRGIFTGDGRLATLDHGFLRLTTPGGESRRIGSAIANALHGWDPVRRAVLAGGIDGDLIWLELTDGRVVHHLKRIPCTGKREYAPGATGISGDGTQLYECTDEGVFIRSTASGAISRKLLAPPLPLISMAMSADGKFLVASSAKETRIARLYNVQTGQLHFLPHGSDEILTSAFSPDHRWLATGGGESVVYVWDLKGSLSSPAAMLEGHLESVNGLAFTPDGQWLISAGSGESLRFWRCGTWESGPTLPCPEGEASLAIRPDGTWLSVTAKTSIQLLHAP
jgi:eukaryotic-like serine/threonine-protein kinase